VRCRILFSLLFALIAAGLLSIFWHSKIINIAISGIGAAVFACYIVFDVQLMMGGGAYSIEPDEYVFASINIYLVSPLGVEVLSIKVGSTYSWGRLLRLCCKQVASQHGTAQHSMCL
jgi:hypothetical protein